MGGPGTLVNLETWEWTDDTQTAIYADNGDIDGGISTLKIITLTDTALVFEENDDGTIYTITMVAL